MLRPGDRIGDYEILELIGEGGMAAVFRGRHRRRDTFHAVKVPLRQRDEGLRARFRREALILRELRHDHIVHVSEVLEADGYLAMVMELLDGMDLQAWLELNGRASPIQAARWTCQILDALGEVHQRGLVHRDLKPGNLFLVERRRHAQISLLDFGIARRVDGADRLTHQGGRVGSWDYMSPEQVDAPDDVDHRADIYAVGVVLYELLAGRLPFEGGEGERQSTLRLLERIRDGAATPLGEIVPGTPRELVEVVERALQPSRGDRYPTAAVMEAQLGEWLENLPSTRVRDKPPVAAPGPTANGVERRRTTVDTPEEPAPRIRATVVDSPSTGPARDVDEELELPLAEQVRASSVDPGWLAASEFRDRVLPLLGDYLDRVDEEWAVRDWAARATASGGMATLLGDVMKAASSLADEGLLDDLDGAAAVLGSWDLDSRLSRHIAATERTALAVVSHPDAGRPLLQADSVDLLGTAGMIGGMAVGALVGATFGAAVGGALARGILAGPQEQDLADLVSAHEQARAALAHSWDREVARLWDEARTAVGKAYRPASLWGRVRTFGRRAGPVVPSSGAVHDAEVLAERLAAEWLVAWHHDVPARVLSLAGPSRELVPHPTLLSTWASVAAPHQPAEALAAATRCVEVAPDSADAWACLGEVALEIDDVTLARSASERSLSLEHDNLAGVGVAAAVAMRTGSPREAERLAVGHAESKLVHTRIALEEVLGGNPEAARRRVRDAWREQPWPAAIHVHSHGALTELVDAGGTEVPPMLAKLLMCRALQVVTPGDRDTLGAVPDELAWFTPGPSEWVVWVHDWSTLGGYGTGIVVSNTRVVWKFAFREPRELPLGLVRSVRASGASLEVNDLPLSTGDTDVAAAAAHVLMAAVFQRP